MLRDRLNLVPIVTLEFKKNMVSCELIDEISVFSWKGLLKASVPVTKVGRESLKLFSLLVTFAAP